MSRKRVCLSRGIQSLPRPPYFLQHLFAVGLPDVPLRLPVVPVDIVAYSLRQFLQAGETRIEYGLLRDVAEEPLHQVQPDA